MENNNGIYQAILRQVYKNGEQCDVCGTDMLGYRNRDNSDFCPNCAAENMREREHEIVEDRYQSSLRARQRGDFYKYSIFGGIRNKIPELTFENYKAVDTETTNAKEIAQKVVENYSESNIDNVLLNGNTGVGKTHLAVSVLNGILALDPSLRGQFVNYAELLEMSKHFDNRETKLYVNDEVFREMKTADVVVIDDLGAELGDFSEQKIKSTNYNTSFVNRIFEARIGKLTLYTTNLTGNQLKKVYGGRIVSRLFEGLTYINFTNTTDKRMNKVRSD